MPEERSQNTKLGQSSNHSGCMLTTTQSSQLQRQKNEVLASLLYTLFPLVNKQSEGEWNHSLWLLMSCALQCFTADAVLTLAGKGSVTIPTLPEKIVTFQKDTSSQRNSESSQRVFAIKQISLPIYVWRTYLGAQSSILLIVSTEYFDQWFCPTTIKKWKQPTKHTYRN